MKAKVETKAGQTAASDKATEPAAATTEPETVLLGKKYKPVADKIKPILGELPAKFRIERNITGDPLKDMPTLNLHPPEFVPTGRYTAERMEVVDSVRRGDAQVRAADVQKDVRLDCIDVCHRGGVEETQGLGGGTTRRGGRGRGRVGAGRRRDHRVLNGPLVEVL